MIYWFTGQPSSGKTTLATLLVDYLEKSNKKVKHIDGDGLRELTQNFDYTEEGRRKNITKAQDIALEFQLKGFEIVVSVVAPYLDLRENLKVKTSVLEFYTHTDEKRRKDLYKVLDYQKPISDFIDLDTSKSIDECFAIIKNEIRIKNQYSMFIGRYQPLHKGHKWLFNERLKEGKNILICVRDMIVDEKNPFSAKQVQKNIEQEYANLVTVGKVKVMIIPDIESINYGRGVGYQITEHKPPENIKQISATKIRAKNK